jgi:hypothetical protein
LGALDVNRRSSNGSVTAAKEGLYGVDGLHSSADAAHVAFPNPHDYPASIPKQDSLLVVALYVPSKFDYPTAVFAVFLHYSRELSTVPKVAINEHRDLLSRLRDIWFSRSVLVVTLKRDSTSAKLSKHD